MLLIDNICSREWPGHPRTDELAQHIRLDLDHYPRLMKNTSVVWGDQEKEEAWCVRGSGEGRSLVCEGIRRRKKLGV